MPLFYSGAGLLKRWNPAMVAPLLMPLQDRSKNTCQFCSHMLTIPIVNAIACGESSSYFSKVLGVRPGKFDIFFNFAAFPVNILGN